MKLIVALCLFAVAAAAPPMQFASNPNDNVELLRYDKDSKTDGSYSLNFEQSDGQRREESGQFQAGENGKNSYTVKGSYHWVGPDGVEYTVIYIADEDGYKPEIQQGPGGSVPAHVASMLG